MAINRNTKSFEEIESLFQPAGEIDHIPSTMLYQFIEKFGTIIKSRKEGNKQQYSLSDKVTSEKLGVDKALKLSIYLGMILKTDPLNAGKAPSQIIYEIGNTQNFQINWNKCTGIAIAKSDETIQRKLAEINFSEVHSYCRRERLNYAYDKENGIGDIKAVSAYLQKFTYTNKQNDERCLSISVLKNIDIYTAGILLGHDYNQPLSNDVAKKLYNEYYNTYCKDTNFSQVDQKRFPKLSEILNEKDQSNKNSTKVNDSKKVQRHQPPTGTTQIGSVTVNRPKAKKCLPKKKPNNSRNSRQTNSQNYGNQGVLINMVPNSTLTMNQGQPMQTDVYQQPCLPSLSRTVTQDPSSIPNNNYASTGSTQGQLYPNKSLNNLNDLENFLRGNPENPDHLGQSHIGQPPTRTTQIGSVTANPPKAGNYLPKKILNNYWQTNSQNYGNQGVLINMVPNSTLTMNQGPPMQTDVYQQPFLPLLSRTVTQDPTGIPNNNYASTGSAQVQLYPNKSFDLVELEKFLLEDPLRLSVAPRTSQVGMYGNPNSNKRSFKQFTGKPNPVNHYEPPGEENPVNYEPPGKENPASPYESPSKKLNTGQENTRKNKY